MYYDGDIPLSRWGRCELVGAWVEPNIKTLVEKMAAIKGISVSEYLRTLILSDLDSRTVFTAALKAEMKGMVLLTRGETSEGQSPVLKIDEKEPST